MHTWKPFEGSMILNIYKLFFIYVDFYDLLGFIHLLTLMSSYSMVYLPIYLFGFNLTPRMDRCKVMDACVLCASLKVFREFPFSKIRMRKHNVDPWRFSLDKVSLPFFCLYICVGVMLKVM